MTVRVVTATRQRFHEWALEQGFDVVMHDEARDRDGTCYRYVAWPQDVRGASEVILVEGWEEYRSQGSIDSIREQTAVINATRSTL